jgi:hypothetical protein
MSEFDPVVLEIIERTKSPADHTLVPNEIRLNGRPLLGSADEPVVIERVSSAGEDLVIATIKLICRRVVFDAEQIDPEPVDG